MKIITLIYRPYFKLLWWQIPLPLKQFDISIPQTWDELTHEQLLAYTKGDVTALAIATLHTDRAKSSPFRAGVSRKINNRINIAQRNDVIEQLEFLLVPPVMKNWIVQLDERKPSPFRAGVSPQSDGVRSLTLFDYGKCENLYSDYIEEKNDETLIAIIATILNVDEKVIAKQSETWKAAALLNYIGQHNQIINDNDPLYPKPDSDVEPVETPEASQGTNWLRIAKQMAGEKHGKLEEVLAMNCIKALAILNDDLIMSLENQTQQGEQEQKHYQSTE